MPADSCPTMPARSIRRWEAISASLGVSRSSGKKYRDNRMAGFENRRRAGWRVKPDHWRKHKSHQGFRELGSGKFTTSSSNIRWPQFEIVVAKCGDIQ